MKLYTHFRAQWTALQQRERILLLSGFLLIGLSLLWWVGLAPAIRTLRGATEQHRLLDANLAEMRAQQAHARALQKNSRIVSANAIREFENATRQVFGGAAEWHVNAGQATVTLKSVAPELLARWLLQAREVAGAHVSHARIRRDMVAGAWSGTLVLVFPQA